MKSRMVAFVLVFITAFALVLNSQGKLWSSDPEKPGVGNVIFAPEGYGVPSVDSVGAFALAFFVFLLIIAFLDDEETELLTGLIVLGALMYNARVMKEEAVIPVLFGSSQQGPTAPTDGPGISIRPSQQASIVQQISAMGSGA